MMNSRGKLCVALNVLKSYIAFVSEQHIDARRCRVRAVGAAKKNAKRSTVGRKMFDVKYFEAVPAREAIDRNERKI